MSYEDYKELIRKYVKAYNSFDVDGMVLLLHRDILFKNYSNEEVDMETNGIQEFRELAERSSKLFSSRHQTIVSYKEDIENKIEVQIGYEGILAVNLPNGLKEGEKIMLNGKSIFQFKEMKISLIEDYS